MSLLIYFVGKSGCYKNLLYGISENITWCNFTLNFLSGEGIDYYMSSYNDKAIEALINDYFNDGSTSGNVATSDDDSDHCDNQGNSH